MHVPKQHKTNLGGTCGTHERVKGAASVSGSTLTWESLAAISHPAFFCNFGYSFFKEWGDWRINILA
jgi:hypothetical protein